MFRSVFGAPESSKNPDIMAGNHWQDLRCERLTSTNENPNILGPFGAVEIPHADLHLFVLAKTCRRTQLVTHTVEHPYFNHAWIR